MQNASLGENKTASNNVFLKNKKAVAIKQLLMGPCTNVNTLFTAIVETQRTLQKCENITTVNTLNPISDLSHRNYGPCRRGEQCIDNYLLVLCLCMHCHSLGASHAWTTVSLYCVYVIRGKPCIDSCLLVLCLFMYCHSLTSSSLSTTSVAFL